MLDFTFQCHTKTIFGRNAEAQAGTETARYAKKALLHYGGGSVIRTGLLERVKCSLREAGVEWVELGGVQPNPILSLAQQGIELCKQEDIGFILAVGGGSVIDSAKTIALGAHYTGNVWDFYCGRPYEGSLPIGVVLTIPAAGSESSCNAVLTNEDGLLKRASCSSPELCPQFAILNPENTFSLPAWQTFAGVSDIMAHLMERYFTTTAHVEISDRMCEGLLKGVMNAALAVQAKPDDYDARAEIMWAGTLAHNNICGIDRSQEWVCHLMGHEISALYGSTHGATLAMLFPYWIAYSIDKRPERAMQFANRVLGVEYTPERPKEMAMEGVRRLRGFFTQLGMPSTFHELGIEDPDILLMTDKVLDYQDGVIGTYLPIGHSEIETIYRLCL